jgi:hypothetical protein
MMMQNRITNREVRCNYVVSKKTSPSSLLIHLQKKHGVQVPENILKRNQSETTIKAKRQKTLDSFLNKIEITPDESIALMFIETPTLPLEIVARPHFRSATNSNLSVKRLKKALKSLNEKIKVNAEEQLRGCFVGLQFDGGKDVSDNKLLAFSLTTGDSLLFLQMVDTKNVELNGNYYRDLLLKTVRYLLSKEIYPVSVTVDNEASENCGVKEYNEWVRNHPDENLPFLLHQRCGPHTIELILSDVGDSFPGVSEINEWALKVSQFFRNSKQNRKLLESAQKRLKEEDKSVNVLKMISFCNTRKWSSSYLLISRILRFERAFFSIGASNPAVYSAIPKYDMVKVRQLHSILFEFYYREQILQRDHSSIIHLAFCFRDIFVLLHTYVQQLQSVGSQFAAVLADALSERIKVHFSRMKESKVFNLATILWPDPPPDFDCKDKAATELEEYIRENFSFWKSTNTIVLPDDQDKFIRECLGELDRHFQPLNCQFVRQARKEFRDNAEKMKSQMAEKQPKPKHLGEGCMFAVSAYWETCGLSRLAIVARLLMTCASSEAGTERFFSFECAIHSELRNRLSPEVVEQLLYNRCNFNWVMNNVSLRDEIVDLSTYYGQMKNRSN